MTNKISGVVENVFTITKPHLNKPLYVVVVAGVQYEYGFNAPQTAIGEKVQFESDIKFGTPRVNVGTLTPPSGIQTPLDVPAKYESRAGFPIPLRDKQRSIVRQNSLTHATAVVLAAFNSMTTAMKAHKGTNDLAEDIIIIARRFEDYSTGDQERREAAAQANIPDGGNESTS